MICETCVICTDVWHNEVCEVSLQCTYSNETECQDSKCQCRTNAEYKEGQCVLRKVGMYDGSNVGIEVVMAVIGTTA